MNHEMPWQLERKCVQRVLLSLVLCLGGVFKDQCNADIYNPIGHNRLITEEKELLL